MAYGIVILPVAAMKSFLLDALNAIWFLEILLLAGAWSGQIILEAIIEVVDEFNEEIIIRDHSKPKE